MIDLEIRKKVYSQISDKQKYFYEHPTSGGLLLAITQKYDLYHDDVYAVFATTVGDIILGFYKIQDTVPLLQQELGLDPRTAALLGADVLDFLAPLSDPNWQPPVEEMEADEDEMEDEDVNEYAPADNMDDYSTQENIPNPLPITNNQPNKVPPTTYDDIPTTLSTADTITNSAQPLNPVPPVYRIPQPQTTPQNSPNNQSAQTNPVLHTMASDMEMARQAPTLNLEDAPTYVAQNQDSLRKPLSNTPTYTPAPQPTTSPQTSNIEPPRWS